MIDIQPGTIIHGTLRLEDIAPAIYYFGKSIGAEVAQYSGTIEMIEDESLPHSEDINYEIMVDVIDWMVREIDKVLPPHLYCGTLEGDPSDFGVWEQP